MASSARKLRRQLGPTVWAVLEDVLCDTSMDAHGRLTARANVRRVAASLGISKDTAARALARLVDAALLVRPDGTRTDAGKFTAGFYEVLVERLDGVTFQPEANGQRPAVAAAVTRRHREHQQPALFDLDQGAL